MKNILFYVGDQKRGIHGSVMQCCDLANILIDNGYNVYISTKENDSVPIIRTIFNDRYYNKPKDILCFEDIDQNIDYFISYRIPPDNKKSLNHLIKNCKSFYLFMTDMFGENFQEFLNFNIREYVKFYDRIHILLTNNYLPIDIKSCPYLENKKLELIKEKITWGIYEKIRIEDKKKTKKYLLYSRRDSGYTTDKSYRNAILWCEKNNIEYVEDTIEYMRNNIVYDPWNHFDGLLYTRFFDYSGRLPFEFSLANKPTIFFDSNDFHRKMIKDLIFEVPMIINNIPRINIDLSLFEE